MSALRHKAASLVLPHNHPSGVVKPSAQEQVLTRVLADALALVEVKVLDHFGIAGYASRSLAE